MNQCHEKIAYKLYILVYKMYILVDKMYIIIFLEFVLSCFNLHCLNLPCFLFFVYGKVSVDIS